MVEYIEKEIAKMELSNPEIAKCKTDVGQVYTMVDDLINLRDIVLTKFSYFLDLGLEFYRLRKNIGNRGSTTFSELESNNSELRKTFLKIRGIISEFDYLRFCLNSS